MNTIECPRCCNTVEYADGEIQAVCPDCGETFYVDAGLIEGEDA